MPSIPRCFALPRACRFLFALTAAALLPAAAPAETPLPQLIGDFSPGRHAADFVPREITEIGGRLFFAGSDPQHGVEPWVSDGTPAGTRRLADLCAGPCPSYPRAFTAVGDRIVFSTYIDRALYSIEQDQVEGLAVGIGDIQRFHVLGPIAYFNAGPGFSLMMRTDGTAAGTRPTADFCPETSSEPCYGAVPETANGRVYFTQGHYLHVLVAEGDRRQLIELDQAQEFTELDADRAIFRGCLAGVCRAYVTNGTVGGTRVLEPIPGGNVTAGARDFVRFQGRVHFATGADRLASTDGTPAGTQLYSGTLVQPPLPFAANSSVLLYAVVVPNGEFPDVTIIARQAGGSELVLIAEAPNFRLHGQLGEKIFFMVSSTLMVTDGTAAGTVALAESGGDSPGVPFAGAYHFGFDPNGAEPGGLFRSDGMPGGTGPVELGLSEPKGSLVQFWDLAGFLVARLASDSGSGIADDLYRIGPLSLEVDPVIPGRPLFQMSTGRFLLYAGDRQSGQIVAVTETGAVPLPTGDGLAAEWAIAENDRLYYTKLQTGQKLFATDGTVAGTRELFDLQPGYSPGCDEIRCLPYFPQEIVPSGDNVFFVAPASGSPAGTVSLWAWREGAAPTELLSLGDSYSRFHPAPGGRLVFASRVGLAPTQHLRLWQSDGTPAGTRPFFELPGFAGLDLSVQAGNRLFFTLASGGGVLVVSDLTTAGTYQLAGGEGFAITELVASGPQVLFSGKSSLGQQAELGYSDGTPAGTGWLDIVPGPFGAQPRGLEVLRDGGVVFAAAGDGAGQEVWFSDGSLAGTRRLTDLAPGAPASSPSGFAAFGDILFFGASDGAAGFEPWRLFLDRSSLPTCPPSILCLHRGRFEVTAEMLVGDRRFPSRSQLSTAESGVFGFFSENNWEMLVKVLDGCAINDAFWVYAAAATDQPYVLRVLDRDSGQTRTYEVPAFSSGPILDGAAFASCGAAPTPRPYAPGSLPAAPARRCADDPDALCLGPGGRYRVELDWRTADQQDAAHPVANGTADSGLFTFFSPSNWESMVKVLDGCAINGKIWVFAAATTDVGWELTVTDRESGARKLYSSPLGTPAKTVQDTAAFDCP